MNDLVKYKLRKKWEFFNSIRWPPETPAFELGETYRVFICHMSLNLNDSEKNEFLLGVINHPNNTYVLPFIFFSNAIWKSSLCVIHPPRTTEEIIARAKIYEDVFKHI